MLKHYATLWVIDRRATILRNSLFVDYVRPYVNVFFSPIFIILYLLNIVLITYLNGISFFLPSLKILKVIINIAMR